MSAPPPTNGTDATLQAILRLLARSRRRQLAPWEEITYFQTPNVIVTALAGGPPWNSICPGRPNRVGLIFSASAQAFISPDNSINTGAGIQLAAGSPTWSITEKDFGPLVIMPWWAIGQGLTQLTVIEIVLREFPQ